jgi:hypothetical protein
MSSDPLLVGIAHGTVFAVGYFVAKRTLLLTVPIGATTLRLVGGCALGLVLGWLAGGLTAILAYTLLSPVLQYSVSADSLFLPLIGKSLLFAAMGAGYTAWSIKKQTASAAVKPGRVEIKVTKSGLADNDSYAEALSEIDENRVDKGTWARCYALSDGDESKAKAAYIKSRAEASQNSVDWEDTKPPNQDAHAVGVSLPPAGAPASPLWWLAGIAVIGIVLAVALPAYQDYSKRQVVAEAQVQAPAQQETPGKQGQAESSEFTSFLQKVGTISTRIERGELPSMDGIALNLAPNGYFSGSTAEGKLLESTQTWWSIDDKNHIHIRNVTANPLGAVTLDYSQADCSQSAAVTRFFLIFTNSIPAGGEAVINFEYSLNLGETFPNCLTIYSPLQTGFQQSTKASPLPSAQGAATSPGVEHSPSPPSKAEMAAVKNYELQQLTKSAKENADLNEAAERAVRDFPYLDTPDGAKVLEKIVARRNELIQEGTHPALALTRAVNQYAAANAPQAPEKQGGDAKPVQPTQNQNTNASGCRWITPQQWSCK